MAVGEKLSCRVVAGLLEDQGVQTQYISLENVIEAVFDIQCLDQNFYDYLSRAFAAAVSKCGDRVPVVTGKCYGARGVLPSPEPSILMLTSEKFLCLSRLFWSSPWKFVDKYWSRLHRSGRSVDCRWFGCRGAAGVERG